MRLNASRRIAGQGVIIVLVSACLLLLPSAKAVSPPPDGAYPSGNTAEGSQALFSLTTGVWNTAIGFQTLFNDSTGNSNTAQGVRALFHNTASDNTAYGVYALFNNTSGANNIGVGEFAGLNLTTESNCIDIGSRGEVGEEDSIRIGTEGVQTSAYMAGITGVPVTGDSVCVDSEGQLGVCGVSSARFKHDIQSMDKASNTIFALRPVTFRYNQELDPKGKLDFGLVAEEVEKVDPRLVKYDKEGQLLGVRYEAVNAMLLNEFLKEHQTVGQLKATVAKQEAVIAQQQEKMNLFTAQLKQQEAQIQKVSAQVVANARTPQLVNSH